MRTGADRARAVLDNAYRTLVENLRTLTPVDALRAAGGYRSILGILKHTAAWTEVYHSYAFEAEPRHWNEIEWPRGLPPDVVETSAAYVGEITGWLEQGRERWHASLAGLPDDQIEELRPVHWGATAPLFDIVVMVASHWTYHAGEINAILAIERGEAWEYTEEVEENHISTAGHRLRPSWMSEEEVRRYESDRAKRDAALHRTA